LTRDRENTLSGYWNNHCLCSHRYREVSAGAQFPQNAHLAAASTAKEETVFDKERNAVKQTLCTTAFGFGKHQLCTKGRVMV